MLIVPVGLQNSELRRWPWASIVVMGLMLGAFAAFGPPSRGGGWGDRVEERFRALENYLLEHPYLKPSSDIDSLLSDGAREELRRRREQEASAIPKDLQFIREGQQEELRILENGVREALGAAPAWRYGFIPAHPRIPGAVTSIFLHGGWLHLIGNLLFFFATGPFLEDVFGRVLFTGLFLSSGVVAAFVQASQTPTSWVPLIGASGAIAGVMGAFLIRLGTSRIKFLFLPILVLPFIRVAFTMRAAVVLPLWFAEQAVLASEAPTGAGVAFWAHIGGFVFGLVFAGLVGLARVEERWVEAGIEREISWSQSPAYLRASAARESGNLGQAAREISSVVSKSPEDLDALRMAFDIALDSGRSDDAIRFAERLLPLYLRKGETGLARAVVFESMNRARVAFSARFGLASGRLLEKDGETAEAVDLYEEVASRFPSDPLALQALARIGSIWRKAGDPESARHALERARRHPHFSREWEEAFRPTRGRPGPGT